MMRPHSSRNRASEAGFTLIELSIVLVLIGLIIGGVLKGQELIASTRLKMTVSQWDAVKAAVNTFQDKYVAIPGDYDSAATYIEAGIANGDGDGQIVPSAGTITAFDDALGNNGDGVNEHKAAWLHLSASELLGSVDLTAAAENLPGKISGSSFHVYYGTHGGRTGHWMRLQSQSNAATAPTSDVISPREAAELDRKFDDNDFGDGAIQAAKIGSGTATCAVDTLSDEDVCTVVFELF